jgi:hypothetical protein
VLLAEPSKEHQVLIVQALSEDAIPARIVAITNVEPGKPVKRPDWPDWACARVDAFDVLSSGDKHAKAVDVLRCLSRVCFACETCD